MSSMTTSLKKATAGFALAAAALSAHADYVEDANKCVGLTPRAAQACIANERATSIAEANYNVPIIWPLTETILGGLSIVALLAAAYKTTGKRSKKNSPRIAPLPATNYFTAPDVDAPVHDVPSYFAPTSNERPNIAIPVNARPNVVRPQRNAQKIDSQSWPPFW